MAQLSKFLRSIEGGRLAFWCPGCESAHALRIRPADRSPSWEYNGNPDAPTFSPSVLVTYSHWVPSAEDPDVSAKIKSGEIVQTQVNDICHSFVTDGQIQFLGDCTHALASQTVPLAEWSHGDADF